jgi:hypothetical protein
MLLSKQHELCCAGAFMPAVRLLTCTRRVQLCSVGSVGTNFKAAHGPERAVWRLAGLRVLLL